MSAPFSTSSLSSVSDKAYSIREGMKTAEQRMKELQKLIAVSYTHLFLSDIGYEKALDSQANGQIKILSHAKVRNGDLFYDHKEQIR